MKRKIGFVVLALMFTVVLVACNTKSDVNKAATSTSTSPSTNPSTSNSTNPSTSTTKGDTIKVGLLTAFSGAGSLYGPPVKNSAELAIAEINASGGVTGKQLELVVGDTATDPKTSNDQAKSMLNNLKVNVLFSEMSSGERNAAMSTIEKSSQLFFYNVLYEGGAYSKNMFIDGEVPQQQITPVYPYIMEQYKGSNWFIVGEDYVWPRETSKVVRQSVEQAKGAIIGEEYVPIGQPDFTSLLAKIKSKKPDFISLEVNGGTAVSFMKQFHDLGLDKTIKVIALAVDENSLAAMGDAGNGLLLSAAYFHDLKSEANQKFIKNYNEKFGDNAPKPNFITVGTYDAIHLWADAANKANSINEDKVKAQLFKVSFDGPRGTIAYEEGSQHSKLPVYLGEVKDKKVEIVHEFGVIAPGNQGNK